ncbi:AlbA family DNA-binding domain-containing protein [Bacillus sp. FJAT-45037]|uniref:AlbA family DNA-binding domain-containing protein n=1 Tax=Bacillus sp. FJAT-45037 TaxID=2011007 RepID=UPI0012FE679D|nr:ATP-binding protein [Bacillus sp. FJAT-45037]
MSNLDLLIKYEREGTRLDFKKEQYIKEKYQDLIKDIMAMANAPIEGRRHIIIGVKDKPDGTKDYFSLNRDEIVDQATFQQIIRENVEPSIDFSYFTHEMDGNLFGVIEIEQCTNPPCMMRKDYKGLKKGECFIRKGSQQERMTRSDLDEMLKHKEKVQFDNKILIGFNKNLDSKISVDAVEELHFPSDKAKDKIEGIIEGRELIGEDNTNALSMLAKLGMNYSNIMGNAPYEQRSTEELKKDLKSLKETYMDEDFYYIGEELSEKINLTLRNEGNQYLEDVSIDLRIPARGIMVMDKIHQKPSNDYLMTVGGQYFPSSYPNVIEKGDMYIIEDEIGQLKHQQDTITFNEDIRVFFTPESKSELIKITYIIYAKNLPNPISGELTIEVK